MDEIKIPDDFPREGPLTSVSGTQSKFVARQIGDRYVVGWTPEELRARHENCEDLVQQLVGYVLCKVKEHPDWTEAFVLEQISEGVARKSQTKEWDILPEEHSWMMERLKTLLGW